MISTIVIGREGRRNVGWRSGDTGCWGSHEDAGEGVDVTTKCSLLWREDSGTGKRGAVRGVRR
jgi:hypothetical protein